MSADPASTSVEPELRFDVAADGPGAAPSCARCSQAITSEYFEAGGAIVCPACRDALQAEQASGSAGGRLSRAMLYGLGGAVAGAALYYAILAITGYEIGLVAIAVGWLVGRAVQLGSQHKGGWLYQGLAVVLTYLAIVSTYIPYILEGVTGETSLASVDVAGYVTLLLVSIAAPFLAGIENVIGLLIIGFALWQAWHMNRRVPLVFTGPYAVGRARALDAGAA